MEITLSKCTGTPVKLEVEYTYSCDPGVHTYRNGDPGYPPSEEIDLVKTTLLEGDILDILACYTKCDEVEEEIMNYISEHHND